MMGKHNMTMRIAVCLLAMMTTMSAMGQAVYSWTSDNGLSNTNIRSLFQDSRGNMWILTQNGLNRFDGSKINVYYKDGGGHSLSNDIMTCIEQLQNGDLLIGHSSGIQWYDYLTDQFHDVTLLSENNDTIHPYIISLAHMQDGKVYACTSGAGLLEMEDDGNRHYVMRHRCKIEALNRCVQIVDSKDHGFWFIGGDRSVGMYRDGKVWMVEGVNIARSLCYGSDGRMYLGEEHGGLKVYDSAQGWFVSATTDLEGKSIWKIRPGAKGSIFICTDGDGLYVFDEKTRKVEKSVVEVNDFKMDKCNVKDALLDKEGNIWVGVYWKGVYASPADASNFHYMGRRSASRNLIGTNCVTAMMVDSKRQLWVCTDHCGVYKINPDMTGSEHFQGKNTSGIDMTFMDIFEDSRGNLWVGPFNEELMRMNPVDGTLTPLSKIASGDKVTSVYSVAEDKSGNMWIGTCGYGLFYYDVRAGRVEQKVQSESRRILSPNMYINDILLTSTRMLLATNYGLVDMHVNDGNVSDVKLVVDRITINQIRQVKNSGIFWLATNEGLMRYDASSGQLERVESAGNVKAVLSIEITDYGHLWISTRQGLYRLDAKGKMLEGFSSQDGLQGNEFSERASFYGGDNLYFGGVNGITYFNPIEMITHSVNISDFRIVDFYLFGKPVHTGQKSGSYTITDKWVAETERFNLCHSDNTFSVEVAPVSLTSSLMTFSYSVNDNEWVELPKGTRRIEMINMSAGTYNIRIKGSLLGAETDIKTVSVVVHPVWFLSTPAMVSYFLLVLLLAWLLYKDLRHRVKARRLLERHRQEERMNEARTQMFMNISHEIRTPMTLILSPLERLMKMGDDEAHQTNYKLINQNAKRILRLINQLMDSRKAEKGQLKLKYSRVELVRFVKNLYELFTSSATQKNIQFLYNHPKGELWAYVDEANLDKIVMNLLSNAFKFTPKDGRIVVYLSSLAQEGSFRIEVTDTGCGIKDEDKKHIFERFYSASGNVDNYVGTGIGLNLTSQLVKLHGGTIAVADNEEGKGTHFTVTIPIGNEGLVVKSSPIEKSKDENPGAVSEEVLVSHQQKEDPSEFDVKTEEEIQPLAAVTTADQAGHTQGGDHIAVPSLEEQTSEIEDNGLAVDDSSDAGHSFSDETETAVDIDEVTTNVTATDESRDESLIDDNTPVVLHVRKSSGPRRFNVVVVEDDEAIRQYVMSELSQTVNVCDFVNGREAWDYVLQNVEKVDMVVSDVMMPVMDGIQLCQHIKKNINTSDISVLLLTALGTDENRLKGLNVGADGYMSKPFNIDVLKQMVMTMLTNRHRMQSKFDGSAEQADKVDDIELESPDEKLMQRIMKVMNENLANPDLSVEFIADKVGLSRVHLHRKMKELTSQTPRDFIKNARLKQAAKLLGNKHLDITQVSVATGFRSISSFSTAFRQLYGMTPSDYMKSSKKKKK